MGLLDRDGLTRAGRDGPKLTDWSVIKSRLDGIGQTTMYSITGKTAIEAVEKYRATGASDDQIVDFADQIAKKHGR